MTYLKSGWIEFSTTALLREGATFLKCYVQSLDCQR